MKKLFFLSSALVLMMVLTFTSCQKSEVDETEATADLKCGSITPIDTITVPTDVCGVVKSVNLVAGRHIGVGNVEIINDETTLYVTINTTEGWSLVETHLYVGDINLMPHNRSKNPIPGHFPYSIGRLPYNTVKYTYAIPLADLPECPEVVVHAVVRNGWHIETAWIDDLTIKTACGAKHWGGFTEYCIQECPMICNYYKAWVTGTQRTTIPFQGYYNLYTPGGESVVAEIVDFRSRKPADVIGNVTFTDDGINLIVNVAMKSGFYASEYYSYFGSTAGLSTYVSEMGGVDVTGLPTHDVLKSRISNYTFTVPLADIVKNSDGSILLLQFMYFCEPVSE